MNKWLVIIPSAIFLSAMGLFAVGYFLNSQKKTGLIEEFNNGTKIITTDSCEYVVYGDNSHPAIVHHQNCKFCKARKL